MPFTRQLGRIQEHPHTGESVAFSHHPLTFHPPPLLLTSKINKRQVQQFSETLRLLNSAKKIKSAHLFTLLFLTRSPAKKHSTGFQTPHACTSTCTSNACKKLLKKKRRCQIKSLKRTQHKLADPLSSFLLCFLHPVLSSQIFRSYHEPLLQAT